MASWAGGAAGSQSWLYKGIALFTPAFDVVYGLDVTKHRRWHHQLCTTLQALLGLPEPPLFLCPAFTATVDIWLDSPQQQLGIVAEAHALVWSQQALLDALFGRPEFPHLPWRCLTQPDPGEAMRAIEGYRHQFPQLWQHHDLVYALDSQIEAPPPPADPGPSSSVILRLYVSGNSSATAQTLKTLHTLLPQCLSSPYVLKVVDVTRQPDLAETDQVNATPTLVRVAPLPRRRLVGQLDDWGKLQWLLGAQTQEAWEPGEIPRL